jgi:hypothetical protein
MESYKKWDWIKREADEKLRSLEEEISSNNERLDRLQVAYDAQRQVGASTANVGASPPSSHKSSSVASIEHHPVDDSIENNEQYLVDDITARTPCELLTPFRK